MKGDEKQRRSLDSVNFYRRSTAMLGCKRRTHRFWPVTIVSLMLFEKHVREDRNLEIDLAVSRAIFQQCPTSCLVRGDRSRSGERLLWSMN